MAERQADGSWSDVGIHILRVEPGGIAEIAVSMDPAVVGRFVS